MVSLKPQPKNADLEGFLIIANFNQRPEIEEFLKAVLEHFPLEQSVVVDDGSTDGSDVIAEKMGFRVVRQGKNYGIGAAIRTGLEIARAEGYRWALISSSNGKIRPEQFHRVYSPVQKGEADYVTGSRFVAGGTSPGLPPFRRVMIPLFSIFASLILGRVFSDITCGFRCYVLKILDDPSVNLSQPWLDRYELEYYLHYKAVRSKKFRIIEVPVTVQYSHIPGHRNSKIKPITGWWSMIRPFVLLTLGIKR